MSAGCPEDSMVLLEKAWDAYPHCVLVAVYGCVMRTKFNMCIESNHSGNAENAVDMSSSELKNLKVEAYR